MKNSWDTQNQWWDSTQVRATVETVDLEAATRAADAVPQVALPAAEAALLGAARAALRWRRALAAVDGRGGEPWARVRAVLQGLDAATARALEARAPAELAAVRRAAAYDAAVRGIVAGEAGARAASDAPEVARLAKIDALAAAVAAARPRAAAKLLAAARADGTVQCWNQSPVERPARDIFELLRLAQIELVFHDS